MGYSARNMSDQRRSFLSSAKALRAGTSILPGREEYLAGLKRRVPYYLGGAALVILAIAWFDGGAEPLHSITQEVELNSPKAETK
jgi:hypothetical protein